MVDKRSLGALTVSVALSVLSGCGGSQSPIGGPGTSPHVQADAASTPLPGGGLPPPASTRPPHYPQSSQPLLFIDNDYPFSIGIFPLTGPNQPQIGSITNGLDYPWGLSLDANNSLYVANQVSGSYGNFGSGTVTVYPYGSTSPSMTYSTVGRALYALADSRGHVFVSGQNRSGWGHVLEFKAGHNREIAHQRFGSETDGMAEDGQGNLYVAYRPRGSSSSSSIAEFGPRLKYMRQLGMSIDDPQGLLVDHAGNIIVVESVFDRIDVFPPGATTPSVMVTIPGIGHLAELAMQSSETTLWVSSEGGHVYSMPYPLTPSTVPTEYERITGESNGLAVSP